MPQAQGHALAAVAGHFRLHCIPSYLYSARARLAAVALLALAPHAQSADARPDVYAYARAPAFALPALSSDGSHLSYVQQSGEHQNVAIRNLRDGAVRISLKLESRRERVRWCDWADDRTLLCGTISPARAPDRIVETTRLYAIDARSARVRELNRNGRDSIRDHVVDFLVADRPGSVLLQHDVTGQGYPQVSALDVRTGEMRTIVRTHPPVRRWMSDGRGVVRLGIGYDNDKGTLFVRDSANEWRVLLEQSLQDLDAIGPLAIGASPGELFVSKHHGGRVALFRLRIENPDTLHLLFADDVYDITGPVILHPQTRALLGVQYSAESERQHFFAPKEAANAAWLDGQLPHAVNLIIDRSIDNRLQLVFSGSDIEPPSLYLFDAERRAVTLIGHNYPELEGRRFAAMRSVVYRARDGQAIPAFLTLPEGARSGLPSIVLPHGGPEARTVKGFDPFVQFLAAQGYAVLQMNFRGSLGYGAHFAAAGMEQWGGVIHNDITDGARWLVEEEIADPARICIVGSSFGGFAALLGAVREAQWYSCAASYGGMSDLLALARANDRSQYAAIWRQRLGIDDRALWDNSPLARAKLIEMPVLLMHGTLDPVVPVRHSRRMARALAEEDREVIFKERGDCDHEMTIESCRVSWFSELQQFLLRTPSER